MRDLQTYILHTYTQTYHIHTHIPHRDTHTYTHHHTHTDTHTTYRETYHIHHTYTLHIHRHITYVHTYHTKAHTHRHTPHTQTHTTYRERERETAYSYSACCRNVRACVHKNPDAAMHVRSLSFQEAGTGGSLVGLLAKQPRLTSEPQVPVRGPVSKIKVRWVSS